MRLECEKLEEGEATPPCPDRVGRCGFAVKTILGPHRRG